MPELRARDLYVGAKIRQYGDLEDTFHEIVKFEMRGDDVLLDVALVGQIPYSLPVLDGDEVVEVE
jgi:hypothetical protein